MDDMPGLLAQNFGIRPQGKSAPMAASKTASTHRSVPSSTSWSHTPSSSYDDLFKPTATPSPSVNNLPTFNQTHDPILDTFNKGPVFDTPVYDEDDIFNGVPGIRSSSNLKYDDVFGSGPSDRGHVTSPPPYDDLLGSLGKGSRSSDGPERRHVKPSPPAYDDLLGGLGMGDRMDSKDRRSAETKGQGFSGFEDLIPGFGSSSPTSQPKREAHETDLPKPRKAPTPSAQNDPFFVVGSATSTGSFTDPLDHLTKPEAVKVDASSPTDSFFSENPDSFDSMPSFNTTSESNQNLKENVTHGAQSGGRMESHHRFVESEGSDPFRKNSKYTADERSPESSEHSETGDDIWLTVSEIPLFTKPTSAPPPSRMPPPLSVKQNYSFQRDSSPMDELDDFATGHSERFGFDDGEMERSSAAMKDAMNKAELKFKLAKEVREKMAKSKEAEQQEDDREKAELEKEERDKEQRRIEREREEERKRLAKDRERARQAVERATREARERAANEAMLKAQRATVLKAQQEVRERAVQESRERAAQEAREKVANEVARERERAEREAKERAEREREAKERAERVERERRMQRAAVEKAAAEARERLAQAAREKHQQSQTQAQTRKSEPTPPKVPPPQPHDDLDSIFGMGGSASRSTSVPKKNPSPQESFFDPQAQNRTASASAATIRKAASTANMMDDLSAIFGAPSSSGEFQEIEGETEDRRKARFEREMRTRDRAAKALAEKNARDMQALQEQAERHRIGETLDFEIKRWAAGKEGNLRSLLSSLHYILWPECGWQPVSMADLITGASVKKVYRKATLCIHPDKVQQKGATLQQKYIAEKVFDILKEAWNKFNSEELF